MVDVPRRSGRKKAEKTVEKTVEDEALGEEPSKALAELGETKRSPVPGSSGGRRRHRLFPPQLLQGGLRSRSERRLRCYCRAPAAVGC